METDSQPIPKLQPAKTATSFWKAGFFVSTASLIAFAAYTYLSPGLGKASPGPQEKTAPATEEKKETPWPRTNFMGNYSFEYPAGWHVSNQWWPRVSPESAESQGQTISILINSEPINTAPRGGPISQIMISDKSGLQNPNEVFNQDRESFKKSLQDLEEETIQADFGTIYRYKGKIDVYYQMVETERYYFTIQGKIQDNINKHIIMASLETEISNSEVLRKIVTSFKRE